MKKNIEYKSFIDLRTAIIQNLYKFPHDADLVVGIPRSGMLPANLLALFLNKPFTDIDSLIDGRIYGSGERNKFDCSRIEKVIVIDDSIAAGVALSKARDKIANNSIASRLDITWAAVYAVDESLDKVDVYCEKTSKYRVFEWNIFHHPHFIPRCCCDIDGVLCPNPPVDDDGPLYRDYIANAPILFKPTRKINTIVSCRLEKYRALTEQWLCRNGIEYDNLVMLNLATKAERLAWAKHGEYKAEVYEKSPNILFIESSLNEAKTIFKKTKKPVFCTETFEMLNDESLTYQAKSLLKSYKKMFAKIFNCLR